MDYYIGPDGELYHGLFGKGKPRDDHKYIKREWKNGKWQYTYQSNSAKTSVKSAKISSSLSDAGKKIVSTARNIEAKAKLENRGKLSLQSRAALTKGRNALNSKSSKPKVSKEYQEEVAYNSKKNDYPKSTNPTVSSSKNKNTKIDVGIALKNTVDKLADKVVDKVTDAKSTVTNRVAQKKIERKISQNNYARKQAEENRRKGSKKDVFDDAGNRESTSTAMDVHNVYVNAEKKKAIRDSKPEIDASKEITSNDNITLKQRELSLKSFVNAVKDWFGESEQKRYKDAKKKLDDAKKEYDEASDAYGRAAERYHFDKEIWGDNKADQKSAVTQLKDSFDELQRAERRYDKAWDDRNVARDEYDSAKAAYEVTPAYELEQRTEPVREFFESAGERIDSGKNWLEDRIYDFEDWLDDLRR